MVWGLVITCTILFSCGIGFLLAERLKLPSRAASRAMHSMGRNRKDKPNPLTLLMRELSGRLAGRLHLNEYRCAQLEADLRTGDMTQTPEQFVAENIVRAGMVAVLAVPVAFVSKFMAVLLLVAAVLLYRLGSMTLRKKIGARRARIELELPRFVANIEKTLPHSRDVLAMLESYRIGAGEEFGRELDITVADMRSGNDEAALTRLEACILVIICLTWDLFCVVYIFRFADSNEIVRANIVKFAKLDKIINFQLSTSFFNVAVSLLRLVNNFRYFPLR